MDSDLLTLNEAANKLGVSGMRVRQLVEEGKILKIGKKYPLSSVESLLKDRADHGPKKRLAPKGEAALALRAFVLFRSGYDLERAMLELELTPQRVRALHKEWQTPLGGSAPKAVPPRKSFADLVAEGAGETEACSQQFDRDQADRRKKHDRDHEDRMAAIDASSTKPKEKRT